MNDMVTNGGCRADGFPDTNTTYESASDYLDHVASSHRTNFMAQRNLADDEDDARREAVARRGVAALIPQHCVDDGGPFFVYNDDLRPVNTLADEETFRITAAFDFEFTNVMPAQFLCDVL